MSKIEWTEITWNPVTGCTKISEGCQNCYAERMHKRLQAMDFQIGKNKKYRQDFLCIKTFPHELNKDFGKKPKMIFVNSMSDLFHPNIPDKFICDVLATCFCHLNHIFQILTKRSERLLDFGYRNIPYFLPTNIWLGVSVELAKYKHRIDDLRQTNAKVKFISFEPLLGDVGELDLSGIHWVIVGGESGPGARPMHPEWVRNIQRQCKKQNVPFFFKQWGEYIMPEQMSDDLYSIVDSEINLASGHYNDFYKVGKKKAGRLLDGKEYSEYPKFN